MAGAPKGNKNGTKLKEPDYRQEAYKQYCQHLSEGYSKKSWCFRHPTDINKSLTHRTMERYLEENPIEFPPFLMEMAINQGMKWFEDEGRKLMQGRYKNGSPEVWKTCMRNKYSWDKDLLETAAKIPADKILEAITRLSPEKMKHYEKKK